MNDPVISPRSPRLPPIVLRYIAALAVTTCVGLLFASPQWGHVGWKAAVVTTLVDWWAWGALAPPIIVVDRWLRSVSGLGLRLAMHLVAGSFFSVLHVGLRTALAALFTLAAWSALQPVPLLTDVFQGPYFWGLLVYGLIVGVAQSLHYQRRARDALLDVERMQRRYSEARLHALRAQLDPHFLFNALNTISAQITPAPRLARGMIGHLGDLLRASLENGGRPEVPLREELAVLDHYLSIQAIRFGDSLRVERRIGDEAQLAMVPNLLLQPLVENAVRHGIASRAMGGTIVIEARRNGNLLDIRIIDDGVGLPPGWSIDSDMGVGLSTTRQRLTGLYAQHGRFDIDTLPGGGTVVSIAFPYRTAAAAA